MSSLSVLTCPAAVPRRAVDLEGPRAWHPGAINAPPADLSTLFSRVQSGDRDAFAKIYDALAPAVFTAVKRVVRDQAMSEEVTQEVFVELWTTAARFDPTRGNLLTWTVTIARRRAVDRVRSEQSQRNRVDQLGHRRPDIEDATDDLVIASLDAREVSAAIAALPADQRHVIELAFIEGYSHAAIADHLGLPLGTVKGRVRGGLQKLSVKLGGLV